MISIRPLQLNVLGLLGSKLARAIAIKRAILGGIISLAPLRPRPTSRPSYTPRPVTQPPPRPVTAPPTQRPSTQRPPSDSYGAPLAPPISGGTGYSGAGSGYHSDVGAVIQVVANSGTGTDRFPSGDWHQSSSYSETLTCYVQAPDPGPPPHRWTPMALPRVLLTVCLFQVAPTPVRWVCSVQWHQL